MKTTKNMPKGPWKPQYLSKKTLAYLHAREQAGEHLGFDNVANIIYTGERHAGKSPKIAARIAQKTAGRQAVTKGIHRGTMRQHIPVHR